MYPCFDEHIFPHPYVVASIGKGLRVCVCMLCSEHVDIVTVRMQTFTRISTLHSVHIMYGNYVCEMNGNRSGGVGEESILCQLKVMNDDGFPCVCVCVCLYF